MTMYKRQRYFLMTTDPVHVGTGGYRLGRVDNSIVREPGTRIPKIPGTSLHGAARSYTAQLYETPEAAGQSQDRVNDPDTNPICYTFGYLRKDRGGDDERVTGYSGVVSVFDAHVLLFPVYSMAGPVWVTALGRLKDACFTIRKTDSGQPAAEPAKGEVHVSWARQDQFNLGWLMVRVASQVTVTPDKWKNEECWKAVADHIVLVQEALFSQVVNSNLEVRTSVAINPERGAAEESALFTYEALPRATFLTAEVVLDDYRGGFPKDKCGEGKTARGNPLPGGKWDTSLDVVKAGLKMMEWLGVGGMGTRGFGRMAVIGEPLEIADSKEV